MMSRTQILLPSTRMANRTMTFAWRRLGCGSDSYFSGLTRVKSKIQITIDWFTCARIFPWRGIPLIVFSSLIITVGAVIGGIMCWYCRVCTCCGCCTRWAQKDIGAVDAYTRSESFIEISVMKSEFLSSLKLIFERKSETTNRRRGVLYVRTWFRKEHCVGVWSGEEGKCKSSSFWSSGCNDERNRHNRQFQLQLRLG